MIKLAIPVSGWHYHVLSSSLLYLIKYYSSFRRDQKYKRIGKHPRLHSCVLTLVTEFCPSTGLDGSLRSPLPRLPLDFLSIIGEISKNACLSSVPELSPLWLLKVKAGRTMAPVRKSAVNKVLKSAVLDLCGWAW